MCHHLYLDFLPILGDSDQLLCSSCVFQSYLQPLKSPDNSSLCDQASLEVMFYKIPEILLNHQQFLDQLEDRMKRWHSEQKIGDIISQSVSIQITQPNEYSLENK